MKAISFQTLALLALPLAANTLGQDAVDRSDLRILLVGHDPASPAPAFPGQATDRTRELYGERTAAFEALLRKHFADVRVVFGAEYAATMSDSADVTIFDARPKALTPAVRSRDEATGEMRYQPATYLPDDFSHAAITIAESSPRIGEPLGLKLDWL